MAFCSCPEVWYQMARHPGSRKDPETHHPCGNILPYDQRKSRRLGLWPGHDKCRIARQIHFHYHAFECADKANFLNDAVGQFLIFLSEIFGLA